MVHEMPLDVNPRHWQPFDPPDPDYKPLLHQISYHGILAQNIKPGTYRLGLWLPDPKPAIRLDPHFAVRVANRNSTWWVSVDGQYGVNLLHPIRVTEQTTSATVPIKGECAQVDPWQKRVAQVIGTLPYCGPCLAVRRGSGSS